MPKTPADASDRNPAARSCADESSKTPPKQIHVVDRERERERRAARRHRQRAPRRRNRRAEKKDRRGHRRRVFRENRETEEGARGDVAPKRPGDDACRGRKSAAHAPKRHAATSAWEKRRRPYAKSGVAKSSANIAPPARAPGAPARTAER